MATTYTDHTERVNELMVALATIKPPLDSKIDSNLFSQAQNEMQQLLGSSSFGSYVAMFSRNVYDPDIEYFELNDGQRKLRMLETAEAYLALYYLALRAKELVDKQGFVSQVNMGEGEINPSGVSQFIEMRHQYYRHAQRIVDQHTGAGVLSIISPNNDDLNCFGINVENAIPENGRRSF